MQRMQSYSLATFGLLIVTLATAAYAWQKPPDTVLRTALITYAKPNPDIAARLPELTESIFDTPVAASPGLSPYELADASVALISLTRDLADSSAEPLSLPEEFRQIIPTTPLNPDSEIHSLAFTTALDGRHQPLNPATSFDEGAYRLYATFRYGAMTDGMSWSWVWRHNGTVVGGGNLIWSNGAEGPGYVYLKPADGFKPGKYTVDIWVNNELQNQASVTILEGISAGN